MVPIMGRLINLKHLHVEGTPNPNIKGIGRLRNLQTVDELHVNGGGEGPKLEDLKNLDHLQGRLALTNLGSVEDASEAEKAQLVNKKQLLHLELHFSFGENKDGEKNRKLLNALQPHPALESLGVRNCYNTPSCPKWLMSLQNLRKLVFMIPDCTFLPHLGKLSSLESLEIWWSGKIRKIRIEFLGIIDNTHTSTLELKPSESHILFPKLKQLQFGNMDDWEEWEGVEGWREDQITIMPSLSYLGFYGCRKLETLPNLLRKTPLQKLHIIWSPILEEICKKGGKKWDKICHTTNIKIEKETVQKDGVWIQKHRCKTDESSSELCILGE